MSSFDYEHWKQFLDRLIPSRPPEMEIEYFIRKNAAFYKFPEHADQLVADFSNSKAEPAPAQAAVPKVAIPKVEPFMLFALGDTARVGHQLSPECHVIYEGWDGAVKVEALLSESLDSTNWNPKPQIVPLYESGTWQFKETLQLTSGSNDCLLGEYLIAFTCHFTGSQRHQDSWWYGTFKFHLAEEKTGELVITSEGNSVVNLAGDLPRLLQGFRTIRIDGKDSALINVQSFESVLQQQSTEASGSAAKVMTIKLARIKPPPEHYLPPIPRKCLAGRFDLPGGRRILFYAKSQVILGRNRPFSTDAHTDIALRLLPRNDSRDALTRLISRQHLEISALNGQIELRDPRVDSSRDAVSAHANGKPLSEPRTFAHSSFAINYTTVFGSRLSGSDHVPQLGLSIQSHQLAPGSVQRSLKRLEAMIGQEDFGESWLRNTTGLDALLIERVHTCDELNGREAYLLVLGGVLIGSNHDCPLRIEHPSIRPDHAILCHWDGQFRILPIEDALIVCDGQPIHPGKIGTIRARTNVQLGDLELKFDDAVQFGFEEKSP